MTDYDLRTKRALRRVVLLEYGFGPETLRGRKVCPVCGRANSADQTDCTDCGAAVTDVARYCPECGARLPKAAARQEAAV